MAVFKVPAFGLVVLDFDDQRMFLIGHCDNSRNRKRTKPKRACTRA